MELEASESADFNPVAGNQRISDRIQEAVNRRPRIIWRQAGKPDTKAFNKFGTGHANSLASDSQVIESDLYDALAGAGISNCI